MHRHPGEERGAAELPCPTPRPKSLAASHLTERYGEIGFIMARSVDDARDDQRSTHPTESIEPLAKALGNGAGGVTSFVLRHLAAQVAFL